MTDAYSKFYTCATLAVQNGFAKDCTMLPTVCKEMSTDSTLWEYIAPYSEKRLAHAIVKNNLSRFEQLLELGVMPESPMLILAVESVCCDEILRRLLSFHLHLDWRSRKGLTALHIAAWRGTLSHVRLLLLAGANPNAMWNSMYPRLQLGFTRTPLDLVNPYTPNAKEVKDLLKKYGATSSENHLD